MQSGLCVRSGDQPEIAGHVIDRIDIQRWVGRFRMIENITGVKPELEGLRFGDSELLVQVRVKSPPARRLHNSLPQSSSRSRERILQYGQTRFRVENSVECAEILKVLRRCNSGALRIFVSRECACLHVVGSGGSGDPLDLNGPCVERADNVRRSVGVQHALRGDACGRSAVDVHYPPGLPAFERACQSAGTAAEE